MSTKPTPAANQEHPLANILINVVVPSMVLTLLSKDPTLQEKLGKAAKIWHLGPVPAIIIALALPIGYGIWFFLKYRKLNLYSNLGLISVILTGALTFYLWNKDGTVKPHAGLFFGIKEGLIAFMLGAAILWSGRTATPVIRMFLLNDSVFDIPRLEAKVDELAVRPSYDRIVRGANRFFAMSFFLSAVLNVGLALWLFRNFDENAVNALEAYNEIVGKNTGWGFLVIGAPLVGITFLMLLRLLRDLRHLTGLTDKELLLPR